MPSNDIEAFEYVQSDGSTPLEIDLLTYAMFAHKKMKWIEHFEKQHNGEKPTQILIDEWISQLSDYDFGQMRDEAASFFDSSSKIYLAKYIEEQKKEAVGQSILSEVRRFSNPWRDFGIALLMAILAPILLGAGFFLASTFDRAVPVHITFGGNGASHEGPADTGRK
jgi:hypothetical protein